MKPFRVLFLLNSCISAFCLSLLAFVLATGDVPFDIHPMLSMPVHRPAAKPELDPEAIWRAPENQAEALLQNLEAERKRLADEREKLADEQRAAKELMRHAEELQRRTQLAQEKALALLDLIDEQERANLENTAKLLASSDARAAAAILSELPVDQAARILYVMQARKAAELITAITTLAPGGDATAAAITQHLQVVADEALFNMNSGKRGKTL